ncbi:aspartyl-phosphate phosphatase Spo0E family protein [Bacillus niameyensis]|uniref:aspartyl-phosphate phosphatase Spo0E family protein n=1 Tax=Bacillus niameyensis TaxID=1522308 RepID=UPI0009FFDCFB|nr:aspartyl-phosphate phosphatase Spo0E family protein [Bacillus niameyensis]
MNTNELLQSIEEYRSQMVKLGMASSFSDEQVVQISDQLDQLLYKYQATVFHSKE